MKCMFVSDVHGSVERLQECIKIFENENADKLVLLGDTGSQMDKTGNEKIAEILNKIKDKIQLIRGNCDTTDFEELLDFNILNMDNIYMNGIFVTITHGHNYNCYDLPSYCGEIFMQGHTHVPMLQKSKNVILANPGSVTKPRGVDLRCYVIIDEEAITLKTLDGKIVNSIKIK